MNELTGKIHYYNINDFQKILKIVTILNTI